MKNKKLLNLIVIIIIAVFLVFFKERIQKIIYPKEYKEIVSIYSRKYQVEENLIYAVIKAESNFDNNAVSNRNALGLMQIMENTAKDIAKQCNLEINSTNAKQQIINIENNINIGTKYLSILINRYDNIELALAAYNAGIGRIEEWIEDGIIKEDGSNIENIPYKETNNYVRKILRNYNIYQKLYQKD